MNNCTRLSLPTHHHPTLRLLLPGIIAVWVLCVASFSPWQRGEVIRYDVSSYYSYLPAIFIQHDLSFSYLDPNKRFYIWYEKLPDGRRFQRMTMGPAILYLPFFLLSHLFASANGYTADGYSTPYEMGLVMASLFYASLGLWLLYRNLKRFFSPVVAACTVICIALGTNLLYYVTIAGAMSHAFSFFLFSAFLHLFLKWRDAPSLRLAAMLGLCTGLIVLIRPTNALILLFPLLYGAFPGTPQGTWAAFHRRYFAHYLLAGLVGMLVLLPQMIYWKFATGHWVFYSYAGEQFYFGNPHIFKGLLGFRKGWLIYTPIMAFSIAGLFFLKKRLPAFQILMPLYFCTLVYITFSWWIWWYGGSFGQRAMIESYALLALPFAALLDWAFEKGRLLKRALLSLAMLFIFLNVFQTHQMHWGVLHWDSMTAPAWRKCFLRVNRPADLDQYLVSPNLEKAYKGEEE